MRIMMSDWMECTTCHRTVRQNETCVCLACQGGFSGEMMPDDYFMQGNKEFEDAFQEPSAAKVPLRQEA